VDGSVKSRSLPHALVERARLVLWPAEGRSNSEIGIRLQWSKPTVGWWRKCLIDRRIRMLHADPRPGRQHSISDEKAAKLLRSHTEDKAACRNSLECPPDCATDQAVEVHRTPGLSNHCRTTASQQNFQILQRSLLREEGWGYREPVPESPVRGIVQVVDEKSQIQALSRTQPVLPTDGVIWRVLGTTAAA
jgi:putative transposase